jgi:hypothetical protein
MDLKEATLLPVDLQLVSRQDVPHHKVRGVPSMHFDMEQTAPIKRYELLFGTVVPPNRAHHEHYL